MAGFGGIGQNPHINGWLDDVKLSATESAANRENPLGTRYFFEGAVFEYVYFQEAVTAGEAVRYDTVLTKQCDRTTSTSSGGGGVAGMVVATLSAAGYGWIQKTGGKTSISPTMVTNGSVVATTGITSTTDGTFVPTASLEEINCGFTSADDVGTGCDTYNLACA